MAQILKKIPTFVEPEVLRLQPTTKLYNEANNFKLKFLNIYLRYI